VGDPAVDPGFDFGDGGESHPHYDRSQITI
jgi:hypothetical protein